MVHRRVVLTNGTSVRWMLPVAFAEMVGMLLRLLLRLLSVHRIVRRAVVMLCMAVRVWKRPGRDRGRRQVLRLHRR